jgi:GNAT superfamily N-acetyltransferase
VIRPFEPGDAPALVALVRACDETYREWAPAGWEPPTVSSRWAESFAEPDRWTQVLLDCDALIGAVAFRQAHEQPVPGPAVGPELEGVAHLSILFVHPSRWREGIAGSMLDDAEAEMVARGYSREVLWTPEGAPAERFYSARGWERDGRRAWHPWVGLAVVGYARDLT